VGNINMEYWMSPNPVNLFKTGDFYDVIGNVWQHTITPIYPFANFQIHPVYEDFTTPTFDERHDLIKGGSFISTGNEALYHSRYAFRRHFHQFAGFRYVLTSREIEVDLHCEEVSDNTVEMNLRHHYLNDQSYVVELA
jgi:formylglycine-generating enzyme required for sulfatase activity